MQRTDLSFQQIYNQLLAGKKLVLHFITAVAAETFRTRMAHHKTKQEQALEGLGLLVDGEEKTVFKFTIQKNEDATQADVVVYAQFALPSPLKKYAVMILEEGDEGATAAA